MPSLDVPTGPAGRRISDSRFNAGVLLLYVVLLAVVAFHHERWRDEGEAWLFARDADYVTIAGRTGYAGHTAPWFLMLAVLAKSGAPYASIAVLNGLFAVGAVALFLWKAPFHRMTKLLVPLSYYPLFEYGVVARHYALTMFMILLVAAMFRRRLEQPILYAAAVFLLSNINVQGLFIGFALVLGHGIELLLDRSRWRLQALATVIMASGLLLAYLQLRPPPDAAIRGVFRTFDPAAIPRALADAFFPLIGSGSVWAAALGGLLILLVAFYVRGLLVSATVLWVTLALFTYLWVLKWPGSPRHHGFVLLLVFLVLWLARLEGATARGSLHLAVQTLLAGTLLCSVFAALYKSRLDVMYPFSGSKATAAFIEKNGLTRLPIAGHSAPRTAAVLPYLPGRKTIWFAGIGEYGSYLLWDQEFHRGQQMTYPEAVARTKQYFGGKPYLLLLDARMPDPGSNGYRLLYSSPEPIVGYPDESYHLYEPVGQR